MLQLTFELTLLSDYHVSAGRRAGPTVDSALLRDYDKAPILRGTALAGLLRDGLHDLIELLRQGELKSRLCKLQADTQTRLFGRPEKRKSWAYSSARPVCDGVFDNRRRWGSEDRMRVRINPRTRRADPKKLFNQEEGDARLSFYFTASCDTATELDQADAALLVAAARMVRYLGSARRRGRGECLIALHDAKCSDKPLWDESDRSFTHVALDAFRSYWLDTEEPPKPVASTASQLATLNLTGPRLRFRMVARALEPVLIASRAEAGNAYETLPSILGTAILGALANRAAQRWGLQNSDNTSPDFITLFLRGGVRSSGLLPAKEKRGDLYPTIPAPKALLICENYPAYTKDVSTTHRPHDALSPQPPEVCDSDSCGAKLNALSDYLTLEEKPVQFSLDRCEEIHIHMDNGRVKTGDLFEYVALQAGQWFVGELDCANDACWKLLQDTIGLDADKPYRIRLGKASQRGYGLIEFVLQTLNPDKDVTSPLNPFAVDERIKDADTTLRILLLTETIVTDSWGRFYHGFDRRWLAEAFGVDTADIEVTGESASSRSVDSFHTHRRMPRWRDEAITPGSTATVRIEQAGLEKIENAWREAGFQIDSASDPRLNALRCKIEQLESEGIGLRRHEGFGRVTFNHPIFDLDEIDDDQTMISLDGSLAALKPGPTGHSLQREQIFRNDWSQKLDESQREKRKAWAKLNDRFEPVARLLFVSRFLEVEVVKQQLNRLAPQNPSEGSDLSEYLWDKKLPYRDKEAKLNPQGINLITGLLDQLILFVDDSKTKEERNNKQIIGLEILADRLATVAAKQGSQR